MDEIHWIEVADQVKARQTRRAGMEGEGTLDAIVFEEGLAARDLFENLGGKVFAIEKEAKLRLVHGRIIEEGQKDVSGRMVKERGQFIAGGDEGAVAVWIGVVHDQSFQRAWGSAVKAMDLPARGKLRDGLGQRANSRRWGDPGHPRVEGIVEKYAAAEYASGLGEEKWFVLQLQIFDNVTDQLRELDGGGIQEFARGFVSFVGSFSDHRKHLR